MFLDTQASQTRRVFGMIINSNPRPTASAITFTGRRGGGTWCSGDGGLSDRQFNNASVGTRGGRPDTAVTLGLSGRGSP